jgi:predicted transposase/invertase (TIGR01784 family)
MLYEERENARRDEASALKGAWNDGMAAGMARGIAEATAKFAKNLLSVNMSHDQIATMTGLSVAEIERIRLA